MDQMSFDQPVARLADLLADCYIKIIASVNAQVVVFTHFIIMLVRNFVFQVSR